jgi:hypothetical protein
MTGLRSAAAAFGEAQTFAKALRLSPREAAHAGLIRFMIYAKRSAQPRQKSPENIHSLGNSYQ